MNVVLGVQTFIEFGAGVCLLLQNV